MFIILTMKHCFKFITFSDCIINHEFNFLRSSSSELLRNCQQIPKKCSITTLAPANTSSCIPITKQPFTLLFTSISISGTSTRTWDCRSRSRCKNYGSNSDDNGINPSSSPKTSRISLSSFCGAYSNSHLDLNHKAITRSKSSSSSCKNVSCLTYGVINNIYNYGAITRQSTSLLTNRHQPKSLLLDLDLHLLHAQSSKRVIVRNMSTSSNKSQSAPKSEKEQGNSKKPSSWVQRIIQQKVRDVKVEENPPTAYFTTHGLSAECFNKYGQPRVQSILNACLGVRLYLYHVPYNSNGDVFLNYDRVTSDRLGFMSSIKAHFSKCLYDISTDTSTFNGHIKLGFVGNSSMAVSTELSTHSKSSLMTMNSQTVMVDKETRRPTPLPDWFKEKYKGQGCWDKGLIIKPFARPMENTFIYELKVRWSDTDAYHHTNYSSYIAFAEDAIYAALDDKYRKTKASQSVVGLCNLTEEIVARGLKSIEISYQNESLEGQTLAIHVWQAEGDSDCTVRCSMEKGEHIICQILSEYHK